MHYKYYYSREQLLANEKHAIQRHLMTIACEVLLMAMMSALCKQTNKITDMFEGSYEIKQKILQCLILT